MKILYTLQQSIRSKQTYLWRTADSNINMFSGMAQVLDASGFECSIDVTIAPIADFDDIESYDEILTTSNIELNWIPRPGPINAAAQRNNFDWNYWEAVLISGDYDVIISNTPEHTRQLRSIIEMSGLKTKIVSQCFWLDTQQIGEAKVSAGMSYELRQIDGMFASDFCAFTCESTYSGFIQNADAILKGSFSQVSRDSWGAKSGIWDFGYSQIEVNRYRPEPKSRDGSKYRIGFLNRITDYTNFDSFVEALHILNEEGSLYSGRFETYITDPTNVLTDAQKSEIPGYMPCNTDSREDYFNLLFSLDTSAHLFVDERYGGCALREAIACGTIPVVTRCHEQMTIVPNELLVPFDSTTGKASAVAVAEGFRSALHYRDISNTHGSPESLTKMRTENYSRCSFTSTVSNRVIPDLKMVINGSK